MILKKLFLNNRFHKKKKQINKSREKSSYGNRFGKKGLKKEKDLKCAQRQEPAIFEKEMSGAFFGDTTSDYLIPCEPEADSIVTIRFRCSSKFKGKIYAVIDGNRILMNRENQEKESFSNSSAKMFDFFSCSVKVGTKRFTYHFEIKASEETCFYNYSGISPSYDQACDFSVIPGFHTPDWAKGAVFYQIYVDRFYNGDLSNDVLTGEYKYIGKLTTCKEDWNAPVSDTGIGEFYGGDLAGVLKKMDYLQDLGVEVLYFNPLFVSPSNHKYDIQDYDHIDPHFGVLAEDQGEVLKDEKQENRDATRYCSRVTNMKNLEASNQLFSELVAEAHKRGMRVILDGVFNHCGSFNKWMDREQIYEEQPGYDKGAYASEISPYHDFFYFTEEKWPDNASYEGWWGYNTLPKLNYDSKKLYDYVLKVAGKWVSEPYCADGWRLDVAADLGKSPQQNHKFWQDFRSSVKEANPQALILAEHYGDASEWLQGNEWDSVMNYDAFMEPITWFLTGMQKHSDEFKPELLGNAEAFVKAMAYFGAKFTTSSLQVSMNELSNHDHSRFLTRTNHKVGRITTLGAKAAEEGINRDVMLEAVVMQMTWPGAPTIYYGDEAGLCGFTDPDNRRTFPWGQEDQQMIDFHRAMIRIHKENNVLRTGSLKILTAEHNILIYGRMSQKPEKGAAVILVAINNTQEKQTLQAPVWELGILEGAELKQLLISNPDSLFSIATEKLLVVNGEAVLTVPATGAVVYSWNMIA